MTAHSSHSLTHAVPRSGDPGAVHPGALLTWLGAATCTPFLSSNPLYLSLGLIAALSVFVAAPEGEKKRLMLPVLIIGLALAALSVPFNVLTGSSGATELASLPEVRFPRWFGGVVFGGALTTEALVTALARALTIGTLVTAAAAFNASVDHFRLIRLAPRALAQIALVLTIAILIVPQAVDHGKRVAEARRLRGRTGRGIRVLPALLLPVLEGALARSVQRAESLEARGFASGSTPGSGRSLLGTVGVGACAWVAFAYYYFGGSVILLVVLCLAICLVLLAVISPGTATIRRRSPSFNVTDGILVCASALSVGLIMTLRLTGTGDAAYLAYPDATLPNFAPAGALAFGLLVAPAFFLGRRND